MHDIGTMNIFERTKKVIEDQFDLILGDAELAIRVNGCSKISLHKIHDDEHILEIFKGSFSLGNDDINDVRNVRTFVVLGDLMQLTHDLDFS